MAAPESTTRTISNAEWLAVIMERHKPVSYEAGHQMDPYTIVTCSCGRLPNRSAVPYQSHLIEVLRQEFPNTYG